MKFVAVLLASLAFVGCNSRHIVGPGDSSLGQVTITGPSDTAAPPTSGKLSAEDAIVLIGAPFVGPTSPVLVMPSNANGNVTVTFSSNSTASVAAALQLSVGAYAFNFQTTDISGSLSGTITIHYGGLHFGENGSCTTWTATNVVFAQGTPDGFDTLRGNYEATCHNSQNAKDGDRGTFLLKRTGTRVIVVVPPPPPPPLSCPPGQHPELGQGTPVCVPNAPPPPPVVDVCPNIPGAQATMPDGKQLVDGQCVDIPPPAPKKVDWCHVDSADKEQDLNITQQAIDSAHAGHTRDYAGKCDGRTTHVTTPTPPTPPGGGTPGTPNNPTPPTTPPGNGGGNGNGNGNGKP
jgi:hypothetical protein